METSNTSKQDDYNAVAVKTAERLHEARLAIRSRYETTERTREQLFAPHNRAGLGVALEYERMGDRPVSAGLQDRAEAFGLELEHLGITIGSVIHKIDLKSSLSDDLVGFIRDTLLERKVVFFRDQHLTEDEHAAFGRRFGDLDAFPFGPAGDNPYILEIRHGEKSPGSENGWHTDVTWMERPSLGSIAQCIVVPPVGGDTLFSDSHACYLGLPAELKQRIQHLHGINDYRNFLMARRPGLPDDLVETIKQEIPFGVTHPLCRTHPETGKTGLYIHGGFLRHDSLYDVRSGERLEASESEAIVRQLLQQHERPEYVCRFQWEPGSIAFWDNRAVQHYAASDYYPHRRLLRRVTVSGDKPYYDPTGAEAG
jgi:taurine dioxygenase